MLSFIISNTSRVHGVDVDVCIGYFEDSVGNFDFAFDFAFGFAFGSGFDFAFDFARDDVGREVVCERGFVGPWWW